VIAAPDPRPSHGEEERAFLQQRVALFWKVVFLTSLLADVTQAVLEYAGVLQQPAVRLDRLATLVFGTLWLLCRRASRSVRFVQTAEALGLAVVSVMIALMGRFLAAALAPEMVADIPGADPRSPAVQRMVDAYVSMQVLLAGSILFVLRAALIPSSPWRTLGLTALLSLPYVGIPALLAPALAGGPTLRVSHLPAVEIFWLAMWWAMVVVVCTVISRAIYGLRSEVREARRLGQYTLEQKLGEGGMGVVYRARHGMMRRPTAVKLLPPEKAGAASLQRFEREVQLTARLTHPHTVTIFDYGRTPDGVFYYAMELLDGAALDDVVAQAGPLPPERVAHILWHVAGALTEAHEIGLIHRDIKPANIMLCRQGGMDDFPKVVDFGLVKDLEGGAGVSLTQADVITGTPLYLSPEAITDPGSVGAASDLYSLGAVGYFALTGEHVFSAGSLVEVCSHHLHTAPVPPSERVASAVPEDLEAVILACLAKDAAERPDDAAELRRRLEACASHGRWSSDDARAWWVEHGEAVSARAEGSDATPLTLSRRVDSPVGDQHGVR